MSVLFVGFPDLTRDASHKNLNHPILMWKKRTVYKERPQHGDDHSPSRSLGWLLLLLLSNTTSLTSKHKYSKPAFNEQQKSTINVLLPLLFFQLPHMGGVGSASSRDVPPRARPAGASPGWRTPVCSTGAAPSPKGHTVPFSHTPE